ncbi:hypothetical protein R1sor_015061 [Riccia sorocarpa]|uniref:Uncharacterized protein n=1 Tax=Riccia sorocarpa TaxID=122646 RepID=A0ABD3HE51_9MARC
MGSKVSHLAACCGKSSAANETRPERKADVTFDGKISTVFLLAMENRSFDHMLGFLLRHPFGHFAWGGGQHDAGSDPGLSSENHLPAGELPNYAVIEPVYFESPFKKTNDNYRLYDVRLGEALIKEVMRHLRASPQWNETLFIVTYEEHGVVGEPSGPTPTSHYQHFSIAATLNKMSNLFLTRRDAWAGSFEGVISLTQPRTDCPLTLPDVSPKDTTDKDESADTQQGNLHEWQQELVYWLIR